MSEMIVPSPYAPPRAPIDQEPPREKSSLTVGYLVGAIVQLALGTCFVVGNLLRHPPEYSIVGLLLLFFGVGSVAKYTDRTKRRRRLL